jgi:hypothetical protein
MKHIAFQGSPCRNLAGYWWNGYSPTMSELIFEVRQESDEGYVAECLTEGIYTQG